MAKLKERWAGRKEAKIQAESTRPDLLDTKVKRERARVTAAKVKSLVQRVEELQKAQPVKEPNEIIDLADIAKDIVNSPSFPDRVANSPGLLQLVLKEYVEKLGGRQIGVQVIDYSKWLSVQNDKALDFSTLGGQPSGRVEAGDKTQQLGNADPPTPPKAPELENPCISSENDFENVVLPPNPPEAKD